MVVPFTDGLACDPIEVTHWITRSVKALRWWPMNVLPLCGECHQKVHRWKQGRTLIDQWMHRTFGEGFATPLLERRRQHLSERQAIEELRGWCQ